MAGFYRFLQYLLFSKHFVIFFILIIIVVIIIIIIINSIIIYSIIPSLSSLNELILHLPIVESI